MAETALQPKPMQYRDWASARAAVIAAVASAKGVVTLVGPAGVGKTLLLRDLEQHLRAENLAVARIDNGEMVTGTEAAAVLLVDEANRIDPAALDRLASRSDQIAVVAILPGFVGQFGAVPHRSVELAGLGADEVLPYIAARTAGLGVPTGRLSAEALTAIAAASSGVPRLLNVLVGNSLLEADLAGAPQVTAEHVEAAAAMHAPAPEPEPEPEPGPEAQPKPEPAAPPPAASGKEAIRPDAAMPTAPGPPLPAVEPSLAAVDAGMAPVASGHAEPPHRSRRWGLPLALLGLAVLAGLAMLAAPSPDNRPVPPVETSQSTGRTIADQPAADPATAVAEVVSQPIPPAPTEAPQAPEPRLALDPPSRIVLTYPRGDETAATRSASLASLFTQAGVRVSAPFPVARTSAEDVLSYFFAEDRDAALAVARLAGREAPAVRLGSLPPGAPLPRPRTIELALAGSRGMQATPAAPPEIGRTPSEAFAPLPAVAGMAPTDGTAIVAPRTPVEVSLTWGLPLAPTPQCCFVEVFMLPATGLNETGPGPREVFSGYAEQPGPLVVPLSEHSSYAWRVLTVSREGPRYTAGAWSRFTITQPVP